MENVEDVLSGKCGMHHIMNPLMNAELDYYGMIGKYLLEKYDESKKSHVDIDYFKNRINSTTKISKRKTSLDCYDRLGIYFLTSFIDENVLEIMYGEGLKHSKFGEGFDDERDYTYISWVVEHNGITFHIGCDHRGTGISTTSMDAELVYVGVKEIIDLFIEKL